VTAVMVDKGVTPQKLAQDIGMTEGNMSVPDRKSTRGRGGGAILA